MAPALWPRLIERLRRAFRRRPSAPRFDLYREIFEHGQGLICTHDLDGRLLEVNPAAAHLLGYEPAEIVGRTLAELTSPAMRAGVAEYLRRIRREERDSGLMRPLTRDGRELVWMYRNVRVEPPGSAPFVLGYAIDLTERVQMEETRRRLEADKQIYLQRIEQQNLDLELRNREIEKADRLKGAFVAAISHELRTPLTSVLGFSDLLAEQPEHLNETQRLYLGFIRQGARHLLQLINNILDLSKIEAGKLDLNLEELDLEQAISDALATIDPLVVQRKIRIETELPLGLAVRADRVRLRQILLNLLSNAVKFTPENGLVRLSASQVEGAACIAVSDTGVGIPLEEQETIFTEFHQVGLTARGIREGTGLGLAIVRRLVEQHGGRIWVESTPGAGSCFTFLLPASRLEPALPAVLPVALPAVLPAVGAAPGLRPSGGPPLVLVADADPAARELLASYLRAEGYRVETSGAIAEVPSLARTLRPDLVTLEVLAGEGTAWQALRHLRDDAETRAIPVVVVTVVDEKRKGFALGAADYLVKPVDRAKLVQSVRRLAPLPSRAPDTVLIVGGSGGDGASKEEQRSLADLVLAAGYRPLAVADGREALKLLTQVRPGVLVVSLLLPDLDAFQTILRLRADPLWSELPVLALAPEDLSLYHVNLLSAGPTRVLYESEKGWKEQLARELDRVLGARPGAVV